MALAAVDPTASRRYSAWLESVSKLLSEDQADELALARSLKPLFAQLDDQPTDAPKPQVAETLTGRETAVIELLSQGHTAVAIAHRLGISPRTVHVHLQNVYRKLGVCDRLVAVRVYRESRRYAAASTA